MANVEYRLEKLSARNYSTWKTVIKSQLISKDLWDYVVEELNDKDEHKIKNELAKHLMYVSMEPTQIAATGVCISAHDLWMKIRENHEGAEDNLRSSSLAEFLGLKYSKNENLISYAGRYEIALGKLESTGHRVDSKTKLWVFSNSLPQHMKQTVFMYNMANPHGKVSDLISQLKAQFHMDDKTSKEIVAYQANEGETSRNGSNQPNKADNKQSRNCNYCKKVGHFWKECRKLKLDNERKKKFGQHNQKKGRDQKNDVSKTAAFKATQHTYSKDKYTWIIDSGASSHMTPHSDHFEEYEEFAVPRKIYLGDGDVVEALGIGMIPFKSNEYTGTLNNVLHVPKLTENLFSVGSAVEQGCGIEFKEHSVLFKQRDQLVLEAHKNSDSHYYLVRLQPIVKLNHQKEIAMVGATIDEWHKKFSHCSTAVIKSLVHKNLVNGLVVKDKQDDNCESCALGKVCRAKHPPRSRIEGKRYISLHMDTVGPFATPSLGGSRYFVLATEEYSGYMFVEFANVKSYIPELVKQIITKADFISERPVGHVTTDRGSEFCNRTLHDFFLEKKIVHDLSTRHCPQQNGTAERSNRTILDGMRTLLVDSKLDESLWAEAVNTVVYTTNRLPRSGCNNTRFEMLTGNKPNVSNLHRFGEVAVLRIPDPYRDGKAAARGEKARFVGYTRLHNTFRFYSEIPNAHIVEACDVKFLNKVESTESTSITRDFITVIPFDDQVEITKTVAPEPTEMETDGEYITSVEDDSSTDVEDDTDDDKTVTDETEVAPATQNRMLTRSQARSNPEMALFALDDEPRTIKDAKERNDWSKWQQAMDEEIEALEKNKTWVLVDKPDKVRPIKNKWVFKIKLNTDGTVERYKARLVAKGFTQIENIDYKETYAPVASMNTIRMFLAIVNQESMHLMQFDVKTAFLYGDLDEQLYMEQPDGYSKGDNKVCKLVKSLYGLKQAPRQWNKKFDNFLKLFDLNQASVDRCLYFNKDRTLLLAIYVDDGLVAGKDKTQLDRLIAHLRNTFELKTSNCESFLGFKVVRNETEKTLSISQSHYIDKILEKFNMKDCNTVSTPEVVGNTYNEWPLIEEGTPFKELAGALLYLATCTRPDISHAVSAATRTGNPSESHWNGLKRILRYLKGTKDLGICFRWEKSNELIGYSDADYANEVDTRRSNTGLCIYYGGGPIVWRCQKQPIITLSTCEAEYVAGCELVKELLPIRQQLVELDQIQEDKPTVVYIDNLSTVRIATNEAGQSRTKHIDIRQKWLTEQVQKKKIEVRHIKGDDQIADILTKPLYKTKFATNRSKLLSQIMLSIMTICMLLGNTVQTKQLRTVDVISTIPSDYVYINGDVHYKLSNIFYNPCDKFFNVSTNSLTTEILMRHCVEHYKKKVLGSISHCNRLPTIGPELVTVINNFDCLDDVETIGNQSKIGKCDVIKRNTQPGLYVELDKHAEAWEKHKTKVKGLQPLKRNKRVFPLIIAGTAMILASVSIGNDIKISNAVKEESNKTQMIADVVDIHTGILKDATDFADQYRESITSLQTWAQEVDDKLKGDAANSRLNKDPIYRGKTAHLVQSYIQWFENQEKTLLGISSAASRGRVSSVLKPLLNGTDNFDIRTNMSTLYNCSYYLNHKSLVVDLDFMIPKLDEQIEVMQVLPMNFYNQTEKNENCWIKYNGPSHVLWNKTSGCITPLDYSRAHNNGIRAQTCLSNRNYLEENQLDIWRSETCTPDVPLDEQRIQVIEIKGVHKIYCHPFDIEIEGETQKCPNTSFILEGHLNYKIANVYHTGSHVDEQILRHVRSTDGNGFQKLKRIKRSPVESSETTTTVATPTTTKATIPSLPTTTVSPTKSSIMSTLTNLTSRMDVTIQNLKEKLSKIPGLNITRTDIDLILEHPLDALKNSVDSIVEYIKTFGSSIGLVGICLVAIMIMPMLEIIFIGVRLVKIPAGMWLNSVRRVSSQVSSIKLSDTINLTRPKRKRWDDGHKIV